MRKVLIACVFLAGFYSCKQTDEPLRTRLTGSDSVVINFYQGRGMELVSAVAVIRSRGQLDSLALEASSAKTDVQKGCLYSASLHFFKKNQVQASLYLSDSCQLLQHESGATKATGYVLQLVSLAQRTARKAPGQ